MGRPEDFRARYQLNRPLADAPGAALEGLPLKPQLPNWAVQALRRGEDVPGKLLPMYLRWHQPCPICSRVVFLIHPYLMPALEEVAPDGYTDLVELGARSLSDPLNPIQPHPCRFYDKEASWDEPFRSAFNLEKYV